MSASDARGRAPQEAFTLGAENRLVGSDRISGEACAIIEIICWPWLVEGTPFEMVTMSIELSEETAALLENDERIRGYMKGHRSEEALEEEVPAVAVNPVLLVGGLTKEEVARVDRALKKRLREGVEHRALGARNTMRRRGRRRLHKGQLK